MSAGEKAGVRREDVAARLCDALGLGLPFDRRRNENQAAWAEKILPLVLRAVEPLFGTPSMGPCESCCGRGWFDEPTNWTDQGMQKIDCQDCRGTGNALPAMPTPGGKP